MTELNTRPYEVRAQAAEKTVEVLKKKVQALYNGGESQIQRQQKRAQEREAEARRREEVLQARARDLDLYNQRLEVEIRQRTFELKMILDHVGVGFLTLDAHGMVVGDCSRSCFELLGATQVVGISWCELLGLEGAKKVDFELNLFQLFEDFLPEELSLQQLPGRFELSCGRVLHVHGSLIRDEHGAPQRVLMTIQDGTIVEQAQRESAENKMLVYLLNHRDAFERFLVDAQWMLESAREALTQEDMSTVRRMVHTIKGNAGAFGLGQVVELIHEVESSRHIGVEELARVEVSLQSFLAHYFPVLGIEYGASYDESFEVSQDQLLRLKSIAHQFDDSECSLIERWAQEVSLRPASTLLGPLDSFVERLAQRLDKRAELHTSGLETLVSMDQLRPLFQSLTHVVRNCLDHGLEQEHERGSKSPTGKIFLEVEDLGPEIRIMIGDDGRGIDVARVLRLAVERGLITELEAKRCSEQEALALIFEDSFSTADQITDVSGRGVGMSAFKAAINDCFGRLEVYTKLGEGTRFEVRVLKRMNPELWEDSDEAHERREVG